MVHVIAVITAKPGKRAEVLKAFNANVPNVRAEQGCIEYGAAVDAEGAPSIQTKYGNDTFVAIEKWESLDALRAHSRAPHMAAYAETVKPLLAARIIHVLSPA
ncbi:MAG: ygiN [Burkholderiales bacterium]|nr:ygiN [Burkholderiales bacterium]